MKKSSFLLLSITLLFASCKTREDIAREKMVETINHQVQDSQKLNADFTVRMQELESKIADLSGKTEEGQYEAQKQMTEQMRVLNERLTVLEESQKSLIEKNAAQERYIAEVLKNLKQITKKSAQKKSSKKLSPYADAMNDYRRGRYAQALPKLQALLKSGKLSSKQKARVIHNLGMVSYILKKNNDALAYFSKLFTEMPKSGYNKNGLLFLAKTFKRLNQKEEMKQTLNELISRWPKAKQVKEAKKLLK